MSKAPDFVEELREMQLQQALDDAVELYARLPVVAVKQIIDKLAYTLEIPMKSADRAKHRADVDKRVLAAWEKFMEARSREVIDEDRSS